MQSEWCREFLAYCKAHGREPEAQLEYDRKQWPGGLMCGFILWMAERLRAFKVAHPEAWVGDRILDHEAKIAFLQR